MVTSEMAEVYVKLEYFNPTASYKDRMALAMIAAAEQRGDLLAGMSVLECTGGSTGSSLAFVCAVKGYPFTVISSDAYAQEKLDSMRAFGARLLVEPSVGGQVTPDLWPRMLARAQELHARGGVYYTNQFHNRDALEGYREIGRELSEQVGALDVFCGAVGTGGMLVAVAEVLEGVRVVALEPTSSPVLSGGRAGAHTIDWTAAGFVPPLFDRQLIGEARALPEETARSTARDLARLEGIFAGTSTGLNVAAALQLARELGPGRKVATVAPDSGFKYLAGGLFRTSPQDE